MIVSNTENYLLTSGTAPTLTSNNTTNPSIMVLSKRDKNKNIYYSINVVKMIFCLWCWSFRNTSVNVKINHSYAVLTVKSSIINDYNL